MRNEDAYELFENAEERGVWAELSDFADTTTKYDAEVPRINEGDIRSLKRRKLEAYWETPNQISTPADTAAVEQFLATETPKTNFSLKKTIWIALAVIYIILWIKGRMLV
jgi:hypothetical protein